MGGIEILFVLKQFLAELLSEKVSLERQIEIIKIFNQHQKNPNVLFLLAQELLSQAKLLKQVPADAIDIVGTGGDGFNTLNFSTLSAFLVARAGYPVIKHGNKSATSKTGSFDFLIKLGVSIPETPEEAEKILKEKGIVFLFAPYFHPLMARVKKARDFFASQGERTIFNLIGPLINPARVKHMCVGVYQEDLVPVFAEVLVRLGVQYAYIVWGNGLDEFNLMGRHKLIKIQKGKITEENFNPQDYRIKPAPISDLTGGDIDQNVKEGRELLENKLQGPKKEMLILNTAAALRVASEFKLSWEESLRESSRVIGLI